MQGRPGVPTTRHVAVIDEHVLAELRVSSEVQSSHGEHEKDEGDENESGGERSDEESNGEGSRDEKKVAPGLGMMVNTNRKAVAKSSEDNDSDDDDSDKSQVTLIKGSSRAKNEGRRRISIQ